MNSIFLRIYGGMCAALILVALLGVLALHLLNEVRSGQYRERLAHGTFALMGDNLQPMSSIERQRALAVWERLLGIPLQLQAVADARLDLSQRNRLQRGQVLVEQTGPHAARVLRLVSEKEELLLSGEVQQISEQLARATIYLLADELVRFPVAEQPQRLADLKEAKGFGFEMHLLKLDEADMDEDQRRRVAEGDTVMALGKGGDSIRVFAGMVGTPWVLEIGPLYQMNPYPAQWLVLIALIGLTLIGPDRVLAGAPTGAPPAWLGSGRHAHRQRQPGSPGAGARGRLGRASGGGLQWHGRALAAPAGDPARTGARGVP